MSSHVKVKWSRRDTLMLPVYVVTGVFLVCLFFGCLIVCIAKRDPEYFNLPRV